MKWFSVLIEWNDRAHGHYFELVEANLTLAEAEAVAKEQRKRGAVMASVHNRLQARKLHANDRTKEDSQNTT